MDPFMKWFPVGLKVIALIILWLVGVIFQEQLPHGARLFLLGLTALMLIVASEVDRKTLSAEQARLREENERLRADLRAAHGERGQA